MQSYFWTDQEIELLEQLYSDSSISKEVLEGQFGRSWAAISKKARSLGLDRTSEALWSSQDIEQLRKFYPNKDVRLADIAKELGRSEKAIISKAYELQIRRRAVELKSWAPNENKQLRELYTNKKVSTEYLKRVFGRSANAITKQAQSLGLSRYDHQINHSYFEQIISEEQAYWLGWLAADGSVKNSTLGGSYISLELNQRDEEIVRAFAQAVAPGVAVHRNRNAVCVRIGSKRMARDLAKYGIVPKKTEAFHWPQALPEAYAMPFILGYFDGDGCLYRSHKLSRNNWTWYILGTEPFLLAVRERLEVQADVRFRSLVRANNTKCPFLYKLSTSNKVWIRQIEAVLNPRGLGLSRKHLQH